eukprot:679022-Prorocentrum_minimum.AAC.1
MVAGRGSPGTPAAHRGDTDHRASREGRVIFFFFSRLSITGGFDSPANSLQAPYVCPCRAPLLTPSPSAG